MENGAFSMGSSCHECHTDGCPAGSDGNELRWLGIVGLCHLFMGRKQPPYIGFRTSIY